MELHIAARVEKGGRATNDDRVFALGEILNTASVSGVAAMPVMAAVCDGCGGYAGGGLAAQSVLEVLAKAPIETLLDQDALAAQLRNAGKTVTHLQQELPQYAQMCTTVAGCIFGPDRILIFHAGDSRVYRFDGTYLAQMTRDHSELQMLVDLGRISPEDARNAPDRNVIQRCIGIPCPPPEIYLSHAPVNKGETYLLCSDGLWDVVSEEDMISALRCGKELEEITDDLVKLALSKGSTDNISVCLCHRSANDAD